LHLQPPNQLQNFSSQLSGIKHFSNELDKKFSSIEDGINDLVNDSKNLSDSSSKKNYIESEFYNQGLKNKPENQWEIKHNGLIE
jgi:hypothetical protein